MGSAPRWINHRYQVLSRLGEGVLGEVYLVRDQVRRQDVALKLIREEAHARDLLPYLRHEFRLLSGWRHVHVAQVYDFERMAGGNRFFFTLEYVPGRDFRAATRGLALRDWLAVAVQLCRALAFVHSRDLIHYDLKPRNMAVMETPRGLRVKLFDFHLAREGPKVQSDGIEGTIGYMAPEVIAAGEVDRRADLYSLGAMFYESLAGRLPFAGASSAEVARLQLEAPPPSLGDLRPDLDPRLVRLVHGLLEKDPAARPATAWEVIQELKRRSGRELAAETPATLEGRILSTRCVGREPELARLKRSLDAWVFEGLEGGRSLPPRCWRIIGESGLGRTRMLREFQVRSQARGVLWLSGQSRRQAGRPFEPFVQVLEQLRSVEQDLPDVPARAAEALGFLRASEGDLAARDTRVSAMERITAAIVESARVQPCVVALEDLHEADELSRGMWEHLARSLEAAGTAEDGERGRPLLLACATVRAGGEERPGEAPAVGAGEELHLAPLRESDVADLLRGMSDWEVFPEGLTRRVAYESRGNPLYVEELMKYLLDAGIVGEVRGRWRADEELLDRLAMPRDAGQLFRRRVGRLAPGSARMADALAVFDDPVSRDVARAVSGLGEAAASVALDDLVAAKLVEESAGGLVRLAHLPYKRLLYRRLGPGERERLHGRAARVLEAASGAERDRYAGRLAWHFQRAGRRCTAKALRYARLGAEQCARTFALREAAEHLEFVRAHERDGKPEARAATLERLGEVLTLWGRFGRALSAFRSARALWRGVARGRREAEARLEARIGRVREARGEFAAALRCHERALHARHGAGQGAEEGRILLQIARLRGYRFSDYRAGIEPALRALDLLAREGTSADVVAARRTLSTIYTEHGRLAEALDQERRIHEIVEAGEDTAARAGSYNALGLIHLVRCDYAACREYLEKALELAAGLDLPGHRAMFLNNLGFACQGQGEWGRARQLWEQSLAIGERIGDRRRMAEQRKNLGLLAHRRGESAEGVRLLEGSLAEFTAIGLPTEAREAHLGLAEAWMDLGRLDDAAEHLRRGVATGSQNRAADALSVFLEGRLRLERRQWAGAEERLHEARDRCSKFENVPGRIDAQLALVQSALGRGDLGAAGGRLRMAEGLLAGHDLLPQAAAVGVARGELQLAYPPAISGQVSGWPDLRDTLQMAERLGSPWLLWRALWAIARASEREGKADSARASLADAVAVLEEAAARAPESARESFWAAPERAAARQALGNRP